MCLILENTVRRSFLLASAVLGLAHSGKRLTFLALVHFPSEYLFWRRPKKIMSIVETIVFGSDVIPVNLSPLLLNVNRRVR